MNCRLFAPLLEERLLFSDAKAAVLTLQKNEGAEKTEVEHKVCLHEL